MGWGSVPEGVFVLNDQIPAALPADALRRATCVTEWRAAFYRCDSHFEVFRLLRHLAREFGYESFIVFRAPKQGDMKLSDITYVSSLNPDLLRTFDEMELLPGSALMHSLDGATEPVFFRFDGADVQCAQPVRPVVADLCRSFDIEEGVHFPVHCSRSRRGVVGLFGDPAEELTSTELALLLWIGSAVFDRILSLGEESVGRKPLLSARERECLRWTASGKTSAEIAVILGLSAHTVDHYVTTATQKLTAANRTHAVALALRLGEIG